MHFSSSEANRIGDFQTTFNWLMSIGSPNAVAIASEDLHLRCISSTLPEREHQPQTLEIHGHTLIRTGIVKQNGDITLSFVDDVNATIIGNFRALEDKMWSVDSANDSRGVRSAYKDLTFTLTLVLLDGNDQPTQTYVLHDCLLSKLNAGGELNSSNDFMKPSIALSYQYFTWKKR